MPARRPRLGPFGRGQPRSNTTVDLVMSPPVVDRLSRHPEIGRDPIEASGLPEIG